LTLARRHMGRLLSLNVPPFGERLLAGLGKITE
jgi:hypothetical protein